MNLKIITTEVLLAELEMRKEVQVIDVNPYQQEGVLLVKKYGKENRTTELPAGTKVLIFTSPD